MTQSTKKLTSQNNWTAWLLVLFFAGIVNQAETLLSDSLETLTLCTKPIYQNYNNMEVPL